MITVNGKDFTQSNNQYEFTDKKESINNYITMMLNRTRQIFEYENLPETIPAQYLELYMQVNGFVCIAKKNDDIYAFFGGLGGVPDEYYYPTICTVSNPKLNFSKEYKIDTDCIIIKNDTMQVGMIPMFSRYATQLAENDISIDLAAKNLRAAFMMACPDDRTLKAAQKFIDDLAAGKPSAIGDNAFLDGIKIQPLAAASMHSITELVELQQYIKASWYNEIGLNANYNMKREALSMTESQMNFDALLPLIDDMLQCRKTGIEKVNAMFGTEIKVKLNSAWEMVQAEAELSAHSENETVSNETVQDENVTDAEENETGGKRK